MPALHARGRLAGGLSLAVRLLAVVPLLVDVTTGRPMPVPDYRYVLLILLHPPVLRRGFGVRLHAGHVLWISLALLLHQAGLRYGLYEIWWWDHLTHLLSGTLVAAIAYALARAFDRRSTRPVSPLAVAAFTLAVVLTGGVAWEWYERVTPDLTTYGVGDTAADLVFNALGALLVVRFGDRALGGVVADLVDRFDGRRSTPRPSPGPSGGD